MESKWRMNVANLIGDTRANLYPVGEWHDCLVFLCARLDTPYTFRGKVWSHVLRIFDLTSLDNVAFARFQEDENVLSEMTAFYLPPEYRFPFGLAVEPDHP